MISDVIKLRVLKIIFFIPPFPKHQASIKKAYSDLILVSGNPIVCYPKIHECACVCVYTCMQQQQHTPLIPALGRQGRQISENSRPAQATQKKPCLREKRKRERERESVFSSDNGIFSLFPINKSVTTLELAPEIIPITNPPITVTTSPN